MVVEYLVVREITFRLFVWGNNPSTDLKVVVRIMDTEVHSGTYRVCGVCPDPLPIFDDALVLPNNPRVLSSSGVMCATCVTIAEVDNAEIQQ